MYVVSNTSYIEKTSQCHKQMEYETSVDMCHVSERKHTNQNNSQVEITLVKVESSYILTMYAPVTTTVHTCLLLTFIPF